MKFPPSFLEEIRQRLPVSAVVGRRVRLVRAGREWKGLSPFNSEKTPSFFVNDQKQHYFDFSSGKNGDIFTFVMETEGLTFAEAVERLAGEAGLALPVISREAEEQEKKRSSLHEVMEMAALFFQQQLAGAAGAKARRYLDGRDLSEEARGLFRLGYAPSERFALRDHLAGKGVGSEAMIEAGLLVSGDEIPVPYDRFRDRVMFPICDPRGRVVAFGGRAMEKDVPAKYLNSPDTPLFHKGRLVYNHHLARKAAHDRGTVIAVEGYVDVIAMATNGFPNTVAPLGTALTEDQLTLLWRMADEPILCFDGDKAGRRAAYRAIDVALPGLQPGKSLRFALLPEGQDPDDLARSGGMQALEAVVGAARPLVDLLWAREVEAGPLDTPERRAALELRLRETLSRLRDEDLRRHYRAEIDQRIAALFPGAGSGERFFSRRQGGGSARGTSTRGAWQRPVPGRGAGLPLQAARASTGLSRHAFFATASSVTPREALILMIFAHHPHLLDDQIEEIAELALSNGEAEKLRRALIDVVASGAAPDAIGAMLERIGLGSVLERMRTAVRPGDRWMLDREADADKIRDVLRQALVLHRRAITLHTELRAAERALAEGGDEGVLDWLREVKAQLETLEGAEADLEKHGF